MHAYHQTLIYGSKIQSLKCMYGALGTDPYILTHSEHALECMPAEVRECQLCLVTHKYTKALLPILNKILCLMLDLNVHYSSFKL